ncbi:phage antirepressor KilAC domain-containing protein [Paraclostridium bifermentans]|uniref:phage antirepressor KilAC domain-containing protein n=1 Tax=Paraclostridium bifermentans TaxID=1490 RepID=UPI00290B818A|nr:phage antirepressor KilAC domain-containing protein [Paraclostridium bifermentans]MDU3337943.1 phage antirepressor KilAC domain-containing protein [Paraclostridium bifermentans]
MKRDLKVTGTTEILGIEVPVIEGGFGNNQKVMLSKTIAEIHDTEVKHINELINSNIDEFEEGVDIIDLKVVDSIDYNLENLGMNKMQISKSQNIYLLSEQGYMTLVMLMRTNKAKEIRKQIRKQYFAMREIINSDEDLKKELLLKLYQGGSAGVEASKKLVDLETKPLLLKIEKDKDKVEFAETVQRSNDTVDFNAFSKILSNEGIIIGRNKLFELLRNEDILMTGINHNQPYQRYVKQGYFRVIEYIRNEKIGFKTVITGKGQQWLIKLFKDNKLNKTA